MKVPKYIQSKMHQAAKYASLQKSLMLEVDNYFIEKGFNIEKLRCGNGTSLEELEYGNDITDNFVREAENDFASDLWHD